MSELVKRLRHAAKLGGIYGEAADRIEELEAKIQRLIKYHHPDCNWWKWDWRYSWDTTDCNCDAVGESI